MFSAIVLRYSDKDGHVMFDDFVAAYIRIKTLFGRFLFYRERYCTNSGPKPAMKPLGHVPQYQKLVSQPNTKNAYRQR